MEWGGPPIGGPPHSMKKRERENERNLFYIQNTEPSVELFVCSRSLEQWWLGIP